jgi:ADP-heptose:LPS heptosyltransferase
LAILDGAIPRWPEEPRVEAPPWPHAEIALARATRDATPPLDVSRPYVVVQPGASWSPRAWRPERFAAVAASLRSAYDARTVVVGVADDAPLERALREGGMPPDTSYFWGALDLSMITALLRKARLFVGNDGGLAHLAAATDTPSVVLFGPTIVARFRPWSDRARVLQHPDHCDPACRLVCRRPEPCVNLIATDDVLAAAREILGPPA